MSAQLLHPVMESLSDPILLTLAKVTLVFSMAWVILALMRRATASRRHLVTVLALGAGIVVPVLEIALPSWELLPVPESATAADRPVEQVVGTRAEPAATTYPERSELGEKTTSAPFPAWLKWIDARLAVGVVWLVGASSLLGLLGIRVLAMALLVRRAQPCDDPSWRSMLSRIGLRLGAGEVTLGVLEAGEMPAVWGLRRSIILLPGDCRAWSEERKRAVLSHELAHAARRDVLVSIVGQLVCAAYWFHPLAWALQRRLVLEREQACDDMALELGMPGHSYAQQLLTTAERYYTKQSLAPVMASRSHLEERIMAILETRRNRSRITPAARRSTTILGIAGMGLIASLTFGQVPASRLLSAEDGKTRAAAYAQSHSHSDDFVEHLEQLGIERDDVQGLIDGLSDAVELTRAASAWALGGTGDPTAVDPLILATEDASALVREWAVRSLGDFEDPRIADALLLRFDDADADVREWAVRSVDADGQPQVVDALVLQMDDTNGAVREWAVRMLGGLDDLAAQQALRNSLYRERNDDVLEWAVRSLHAGDPRSVDALIDVLTHRSANVREWAVRGLSGAGDGRAVIPLIGMLDDPSREVREWVVRSLGDSGDPRAIAPLRARLDDESANVRDWAERVLRELEG